MSDWRVETGSRKRRMLAGVAGQELGVGLGGGLAGAVGAGGWYICREAGLLVCRQM